MEKKLYRSRENKVVSGVCGGIAEYFDIDATLIRLLWAITILFAGTGILAYVLCILIIPEAPMDKVKEDEDEDENAVVDDEETTNEKREIIKENKNSTYGVGLIFIAVGMMFIARKIFWWLNIDFAWGLFWPMLLVFFGVYLIVKKRG
ncbi:MAG: PspC domain-containing protein [Bacillota bacterium]|nr:PspC domain-containing protein [Bacillota bacterium]